MGSEPRLTPPALPVIALVTEPPVAERPVAEAPLLAKGTRDLGEQARAITTAAPVAAAPSDISVASVVHDLRTPLSIIALEAELLLERLGPTAEPAVCRGLVRIGHNVGYLERLVGELLDLAADGDGHLALRRESVDLGELAAATLGRAVSSVERRRVALVVTGPVVVEGDARRLERVIANLVGNALKFSAEAVTVRVSIEGPTAVLSVSDRGPGLSATQARTVFDRFARADGSRGLDGYGLGLYVCKRIVDAHGGVIGVTSTPGAGARFHVELPVARG